MASQVTDRKTDAPAADSRSERPFLLLREVGAIVVFLAAIFLMISLLVDPEDSSLVGPAGTGLAFLLRWMFGAYVCFFFPIALAAVSVLVFVNRAFRWSWLALGGFLLVLLSVTGLIALPLADDPDFALENFRRAGAIGNFMVGWEGLRLVGFFGTVGGGFILVGMGLLGTAFMTSGKLAVMLRERVEAWGEHRRSLAPEAPGTAQPTPLIAEPKAPKTRQRKTATLFPLDEEEEAPRPPAVNPEPELELEPGRGGFLSRLFGDRGKRPLPEPAEEEQIDIDPAFTRSGRYFDADAEAAAAALEEARIDEEYERALRAETFTEDEEEDVFPFDANDPDDKDGSTPAILQGNPANDRLIGAGLSRLFPNRWEQHDGATTRRSGKDSKADLKDPLAALEEDFETNADNDDDLLFDEQYDTRPAGLSGALEAERKAAQTEKRLRSMSDYRLPEIELLADPPVVDNRMSRDEMLEISQTLKRTFADFNIAVDVTGVRQGPVVTRFELKPAPGVKVSRIVSLEHDIAMAMSASSVRIVAPIPGKAAIGIEVPNKNRAGVYLKELVSCPDFWDHASPLAFALGKTIEGLPYFADLKKMPHLLIAGATGAGKSVCLNTIICSFLYRQRPDRLRLLMVDPKRVELSIYQGIPHLISPVVCDAKRAAAALAWAVEQMEERYKTLVEFKVRNIDGYNEIVLNPDKHPAFRGRTLEVMPHMVVVVDELADLMVVAKNEVEESIQRLAQMSRAVGIHLILATQRPSVNVITGIIKANFPTRIAFQVSQKVDSRTILDGNGAETLLGRGDMLFAPAGAQKPIRIQGAFLSDEEVEHIANHCREMAEPMYDVEDFEPLLSEKEQRELAKMMGSPVDMDELDLVDRAARGTNKVMGKVSAGMFVPHEGGSASAGEDELDEALVRAAARVILEARSGSTSLVQRRLKVGFARAGRLMDMLQEMGIIGPYNGSKPRDILVDCDAALAQLDALEEQLANGAGNSRKAAELLDRES